MSLTQFLNRFSYSWIPTHTLTSQSTSLLWNHFFTEVHFFLGLLLFLDPSAAERAVRTFKWPPTRGELCNFIRLQSFVLDAPYPNNTNNFNGCKKNGKLLFVRCSTTWQRGSFRLIWLPILLPTLWSRVHFTTLSTDKQQHVQIKLNVFKWLQSFSVTTDMTSNRL